MVASLDLQQDISDVLPALQRLQQKSEKRLIDVLLGRDFQAIESITLLNILNSESSQDNNRLNEIWSVAVSQKQKKLAQQIMSPILQEWSSSNTGQEAILQWVDSAGWDAEVDKPILREAVMQNRTYFSSLTDPTNTSNSAYSQGLIRLRAILKDTEPPPPPAPSTSEPQRLAEALKGIPLRRRPATPGESLPIRKDADGEIRQSASRSPLRGWLIALAMLGILAAYFAVPFDLPAHTTLVHQLLARFFEIVYVYGGILVIFAALLAAIMDEDREFFIGIGIGLLVAVVVCFFLQIKFFPLMVTFWGQVILIGLLGAFWLPLLALLLPPRSTSESS